jgi:hypothetical protein
MVYEGFARAGTPVVPGPTPTPNPSANVVISAVHYDGTVSSAEPDEYVEIRNESSIPVNMYGWTIQSVRGGQSFVIPNGQGMGIGQMCRLYTNEDHPEVCFFNWHRASAQWNNSGDRVNLVDGLGRIVSTFGWGGY